MCLHMEILKPEHCASCTPAPARQRAKTVSNYNYDRDHKSYVERMHCPVVEDNAYRHGEEWEVWELEILEAARTLLEEPLTFLEIAFCLQRNAPGCATKFHLYCGNSKKVARKWVDTQGFSW